MNNNFYLYEVLQKEKFEEMQKESEKARLLSLLSEQKVNHQDNKVSILEKLVQFKNRLAMEVKSLSWSLR